MRPIEVDSLLVWHYTTGQNFIEIVDSGELRPTVVGVQPPERGILWFSAHPQWEPTACKLLIRGDGTARRLSMEETYVRGRGLVRFGIDRRLLTPWNQLPRIARMSRRMAGGLERARWCAWAR